MRIAAFTGKSGAGKTTLVAALIRHFVANGERVAAIKHTHHALNEERRGDTLTFETAGANPVLMAGDDEAVVFTPEATRRVSFASPPELLTHIGRADIVLIEGFQKFEGWPHIVIERTRPLDVEDALAMLSRIWRTTS